MTYVGVLKIIIRQLQDMVPSNFTESPRTEVSRVKWFTDGVSFVL